MDVISIEDFNHTYLRPAIKQNLDPVFDLSWIDPNAKNKLMEIFTENNIGMELASIIPNYDGIGSLSYIASYDENLELSTNRVGESSLAFAKAIISYLRNALEDDQRDLFLPVVLKWHVGVALYLIDSSNDGSSIYVSEPNEEDWSQLEEEMVEHEWNSSGQDEHDRDEFMDILDWGEVEMNMRDAWQIKTIEKHINSLGNK
jgi:hypothetical protein